jgi:hypothetical protein
VAVSMIHGDFSIMVKSKRCEYNFLTGTAIQVRFPGAISLLSLWDRQCFAGDVFLKNVLHEKRISPPGEAWWL